MNVIGHDDTFFDIQSTRAKQYGISWRILVT